MSGLSLTILNGPNRNQSMTLVDGSVVVGRSASVDFHVMDLRMSRRHYSVHFRDGQWCLQDLGSRNGTLVNEQRTREHVLREGDTILAGDTAFLVRIVRQAAAADHS